MSKNAFATAKPVSKSKPGKAPAPVVAISGLQKYAAIVAMEKAIKAVKSRYESVVKSNSLTEFVKVGSASGSQPDNFKSSEGKSDASVQLKKRISSSVLTAEEIALCNINNIPTEMVVGNYIINPAYANMSELMEKVGMAIAKVTGVPDDFILKQEDKVVASEAGIAAIFATKNNNIINTLLPIQTTVALRTSTALTVNEAFDLVKDDLVSDDD